MRLNGKPGDERGLIHGRLFGAARGFLTGGPLGAVSGFAGGGGGGPLPFSGGSQTFLQRITAAAKTLPWETVANMFGISIQDAKDIVNRILPPPTGNGGCLPQVCTDPRLTWNSRTCSCEAAGSPLGGVGEAVLGRYGAALEPMFQTINKMVCLPGMVLGKPEASGLSFCYNRSAISNKERLWPKGRAPLLTGGEMAAIAKASSAVKKFQRTGARFRSLGLIKTPAPRRAKALPAARTVKVLESGPGSVQL